MQFIVGLRIASVGSTLVADGLESTDAALNSAHLDLGISFLGSTASLVLLVTGLVFLLLGIYQTARLVERLSDQTSGSSSSES